jgi:hypothetical protein
VWVQCAEGKLALGGGSRLGADQGDAVASKIQVIASEPTQIKDGKVDYNPIHGDEAGSFLPNGWLVEVINNNTTDATVRPWLVCAETAAGLWQRSRSPPQFGEGICHVSDWCAGPGTRTVQLRREESELVIGSEPPESRRSTT